MPQEIEKKFLLSEGEVNYSLANALVQIYPSIEALRKDVLANGEQIHQGYLDSGTGLSLLKRMGLYVDFKPAEARLRNKAGKLTFTVKSAGGTSRGEMETEIPQELFDEYWSWTSGDRVEKVRLSKPYGNHVIEIDVYTNRDLVVAEVEVRKAEELKEILAIGRDISDNPDYKNRKLAK